MTITYPLQLPSYRIKGTDFDLTTVDSVNTLRGGASFGTEISPAYWATEVQTAPLDRLEHGKWDAFFDSLRGPKKSFLMYDANRPQPLAYPNVLALIRHGGTVVFDGTAQVSSFPTVRQINLQLLPDLMQFLRGDYVGLAQSGKYSLHRIQEDVTGSNLGLCTLNVEPAINTSFFTSAATCTVYHPVAEFIIKVGTRPVRNRELENSPVSFSATSKVQ